MNKIILALSILATTAGFAAESKANSKEDVQTALQVLRPQSPGQVQIGEYAGVETTETLQGSSPILRLQEATTVLQKFENSNLFQFQIVYDRAEYRDGRVLYSTERGQVAFQKDRPTIFENIAFGHYSNLKSEAMMINVPEKVLKRKNCGGLSGCPTQVSGQKVSFYFTEFNGRTWLYEIWGSAAVPFLATPMKLCKTTTAPFGDHELNVTTCKETVDFTAGK